MNSITLAALTFACIFSGVIVGWLLRRCLPGHHVEGDSRDIIKLGAGFVATMAALVLGLLVSSAKSSFDSLNEGFKQAGVKMLLLDRTLKQIGPEAEPLRDQLRHQARNVFRQVWPEQGAARDNAAAIENNQDLEKLQLLLRLLPVKNDSQKALQAQAIAITGEMMQSRWLMIEHTQNALPPVFFMVVVFWLTILHVSFGVLAPHNRTVLVVLLLSSLSIAAALFLINEMNNPLDGVIQLSSAPMQKVLDHLGK
jgi:hypothetical protein